MQDSEIIDLFFVRDERALRETEAKYGAYCYRVSWNILRVKEDAEECVNECFYKAWNAIPPLVPANFRAWLAKLVRNISINLFNRKRAKKRYAEVELSLSELEECIPANMEAEENEEELGKVIDGWLRTLEKVDRRLFLLRYFEGMKVKEIAQAEHMDAKKISKRLFTLRGQLKKVLEVQDR